MRLVTTSEGRFARDESGQVWSAAVPASYWDRYLEVFDEALVVARVERRPAAPEGWHRVGGPRVSFHPLPHYVGPAQYLRRWPALRRAVCHAGGPADAYLFRMPSPIAAAKIAGLRPRHPYAVEIVGDPYDTFAEGAVHHPLRRAFRWHFTRQMRQVVAGAAAVAYVNTTTLPARYPAAPGAYTATYSSIDMPSSAYASDPRTFPDTPSPARLLFVGSLEQIYKAPDVLLDAVAACVHRGLDLALTMVGEGRFRPELERQADRLGISGRVHFLGAVPPGHPIRDLLDAADVFVLPSRVEGMPRAMIEAMARGLPCIGSTIGGIPELLSSEDLVSPDDVDALTAKLADVLTDSARLERMAARNLERSRDYAADILSARRTSHYAHPRAVTEKHLAR